jgi:phenylacetate-CoA ligase
VRKPICWDHASLLLRLARNERDRIVCTNLAGESWREAMVREFVVDERRRMLARLAGIGMTDHQRLQILPISFSSRTQRVIAGENSVIPRAPLHYHLLSPMVPLEVAAAQIMAIRPRIVWSLGSYADQFFRSIDSSGAEVPLPRLWVYLGDPISPVGKSIAEARDCRVYSVYGAIEAGTIGFQCELRDGFHLNLDLCAVRLVDEHGRDVPAGESGQVVISVLDNRAMVLLNYKLGDTAMLSGEPCPCGRSLPLLARLDGRRSEVVKLADGRELSTPTLEALFSYELRRTIAAQMRQSWPGDLRWTLVPAAGVDRQELRDAMLDRSRRVLGESTTLEITFADEVPRTAAGKFLRVVNDARRGG